MRAPHLVQELVPGGFICALGQAVWMVLFPKGVPAVSALLFGAGVAVVLYFFYRVRYQLKAANAPIYANPIV